MSITVNVTQPEVKLIVFKSLDTPALRRPTEKDAFCWFLMQLADDSSLLFVDSSNNALKKVNLQNELSVDVIYRCESSERLRAALFVEFAPQQKALLVAAMRPDAAANSMSHSLSVALGDATRWTRRQTVPLDTATCKLNYTKPFSVGAVHTNKVLCGAWNTSSLEAFAIDSSGAARRLQPIPLGFPFGCFATSRSQDTELLAISHSKWAEVRLLRVADGESLSLRLLRVIENDGNRLLWRAGRLFAAAWNAQTETFEVSVWHVSVGGRRVERCGAPITHKDNLRIDCWSAVGERIALSDFNSKKILIYELKN